ncbi:MAG: hypothetical protein MUE84_11485 [Hyphomonas sp.]|nr:hypothetical protein [Hyphomonas sp.]
MTQYSRQNPSPTFRKLEEMYKEVHLAGFENCGIDSAQTFDGISLYGHIAPIRGMIAATGAPSVLDFGSGKGQLYKESGLKLSDGTVINSVREYWGVDDVTLYDPGVPEYAQYPSSVFGGVISTDVLEHIPEDDIPWMLKSFFDLSTHFVYANIAAYPARKILPNGWNKHSMSSCNSEGIR